MNINGLKVPIPSGSLNIAGGVAYRENPDAEFGFDQIFIPPTDGTKGVYSSPIEVPGGIFGLGIPVPRRLDHHQGNSRTGRVANSRRIPTRCHTSGKIEDLQPLAGRQLLSGFCEQPDHVSNSEFPKMVSWRKFQDFRIPPAVRNVTHADQTFAVPGASGCGLFGALNWAVNLRANVPSSSGHNSLTTTSDVFNIGARQPADAVEQAPATHEVSPTTRRYRSPMQFASPPNLRHSCRSSRDPRSQSAPPSASTVVTPAGQAVTASSSNLSIKTGTITLTCSSTTGSGTIPAAPGNSTTGTGGINVNIGTPQPDRVQG